jgi:hypothetical protein
MERFLQMTDEDPYALPEIDEAKWFTGGHLGSQVRVGCGCGLGVRECTFIALVLGGWGVQNADLGC